MLKELLYQAVNWIATVHDKISQLNNQFEGTLSDKQMHFLVIGILGILLIFIIHHSYKVIYTFSYILCNISYLAFTYIYTKKFF